MSDTSQESNSDNINALEQKIMCYICNLQVPKQFIQNHMKSSIHNINIQVMDKILERSRKFISTDHTLQIKVKSDNEGYCEICNVTYDTINILDRIAHESSEQHKNHVIYNKILPKICHLLNDVTNNLDIMDDIKKILNNDYDKSKATAKAASSRNLDMTYCDICNVYKTTHGFKSHMKGRTHREKSRKLNIPEQFPRVMIKHGPRFGEKVKMAKHKNIGQDEQKRDDYIEKLAVPEQSVKNAKLDYQENENEIHAIPDRSPKNVKKEELEENTEEKLTTPKLSLKNLDQEDQNHKDAEVFNVLGQSPDNIQQEPENEEATPNNSKQFSKNEQEDLKTNDVEVFDTPVQSPKKNVLKFKKISRSYNRRQPVLSNEMVGPNNIYLKAKNIFCDLCNDFKSGQAFYTHLTSQKHINRKNKMIGQHKPKYAADRSNPDVIPCIICSVNIDDDVETVMQRLQSYNNAHKNKFIILLEHTGVSS